ncbi:MAG: hydantoinase/oxoprolinase family protein [Burkholderiaceae bacterium]
MGWQVGSDIGGTFTDVAYIDAQGRLATAKVPSTPEHFGRGVVDGVARLAQAESLSLTDLEHMAHGCTVATNAILERKGARTALLTTAGFRDVLELRRIRVPRLYEPLYVKPPPLVPRALRLEARERLDAQGGVVTPLNLEDVREAAQRRRTAGVQAVAVCFLHAFRNPAHERAAGELLRAMLPEAFVCLSVDVLPQVREYERTSTTVINAYVGPPVRDYLDGMRDEFRARASTPRISVMQSSGGTLSADAVRERPAQIVECGPAAGVVGAALLARRMGIDQAISFDMGGTTAKASIVENGELVYADSYEVGAGMSAAGTIAGGGGYALSLPVIDIAEVGAGGGSIVRIDRAGAIRVGPDSAGAEPGPAAYGLGGHEPTVTDANIVCGFLNQHTLAGGTVGIDAELARRALETAVGAPLGLPAHEAALGVHAVANATMVRAIKAVTTYRGRDPREFTMFAFGGNGGVHGVGIARSLEIRRVVVPPAAGVFSAVGLLLAERSVTLWRACAGRLDDHDPASALDAATLDACQAEMREEAARLLQVDAAGLTLRRELAMRYVGQAFELSIDIGSHALDARGRAAIRAAFDAEHERRFGHAFDADSPVEVVAAGLRATDPGEGRAATLRMAHRDMPPARRRVWFGAPWGWCEVDIIGRHALDATPRQGGFIIEEPEGTTVVPPDARAHRDAFDNIVIELIAEAA